MGFSFRGVHIKSIGGIASKTINFAILPESKEIVEDNQYIDGEYDFSESNIDKHIKYNTRTFEQEIFFITKNKNELHSVLSKMAEWLSDGYGELIFDERPDIIWTAKVSNQIDFEKLMFRAGKASIYFKAKPFARAVNITEYNFDINTNSKVTIENRGWYIKPIIKLSGDFSDLSITCNNRSISYSLNTDNLIIDNEKMIITKGNADITGDSKGNFIELKPGTNEINFTLTGNAKAVIQYFPLFLY